MESKGLSIAAFIFGLLGILLCCINFPCAIIGLILAIIALAKRSGGKGFAIAGLITSLITLIVSAFVGIAMMPVMPYMNGFIDLGQHAQEYVEEYEESGEYPPVIQDMMDDGLLNDDAAKQTMDQFVENLKKTGSIK